MNARALEQMFEVLGQIREEITLLQTQAADLEDEQFSVAVDRMRTWAVTAGNRVAVLRRVGEVAA